MVVGFFRAVGGRVVRVGGDEGSGRAVVVVVVVDVVLGLLRFLGLARSTVAGVVAGRAFSLSEVVKWSLRGVLFRLVG